ncbi:MAG TPA: ADP-ribosylglycohydrolase family protein [Clostridiaceae bacterium]|nr:ADP-ribosylglycohydrolase family protein [Clostridiaceae bacterium]
MRELSYHDYMKKLLGCYTGKAVGGTLGMPYEGVLRVSDVTYYDGITGKMAGNDDLDLQVVWLENILRCGLPINRRTLADSWEKAVACAPDEYGVCRKNIRCKLFPPLSGYYDNKFGAGMGAAIRTEIWAALCPGDPDLAVKLTKEDAICDHFDDGVHASAFIAAIESAAYMESDKNKLLETGFSFLPDKGRLTEALRDTVKWCEQEKDYLAVRKKILDKYYVENWTDVTINLSFIVTAWLLGGDDFSRSLCMAVNMGYDTDCTAATLGAIMGTINPEGIDKKWTEPIGNELVLSSCILATHEAPTIQRFCQQVAWVGSQVRDYYKSNVKITGIKDDKSYKNSKMLVWAKNDRNISLEERFDYRDSLISVKPLTVNLTYPESIALAPGESGLFMVKLSNPTGKPVEGHVVLKVPEYFEVSPGEFDFKIDENGFASHEFAVTAPNSEIRRNSLNLLDFNFETDQFVFTVSAGIVTTYPWRRVKKEYTGNTCPTLDCFAVSEEIHVPSSYQHVPAGEHLYTIEVKAHADVRTTILAQSTRPVKAWIDDDLVICHNGDEYIMAFHRSKNSASYFIKAGWHRVTIWVGDNGREGELFFGMARELEHEWLNEFEYRMVRI